MHFSMHTIPNALRSLRRTVRSLFAKDERTLATEYVQAVREARCRLCPHFDREQCTKCTCFVGLKVLLAYERCPDNPPRWREQGRYSTGL